MRKTIPSRWRWTIVGFYVAAIYSTLGLAREWLQVVKDYGSLQVVTVLVLGFALFAALYPGWRYSTLNQKFIRVGIVSVLILVAYLLKFPEERIHLVEYGLLGIMLSWALAGDGRWPDWWWMGVFLSWLFGYGDEYIQHLLPNRVYDVRDILLNGFSGMAGLALYQSYGQPPGSFPIKSGMTVVDNP